MKKDSIHYINGFQLGSMNGYNFSAFFQAANDYKNSYFQPDEIGIQEFMNGYEQALFAIFPF